MSPRSRAESCGNPVARSGAFELETGGVGGRAPDFEGGEAGGSTAPAGDCAEGAAAGEGWGEGAVGVEVGLEVEVESSGGPFAASSSSRTRCEKSWKIW